jgi:hypothetical protein
MKGRAKRRVCAVLLVAALGGLALAGSAAAEFTGELKRFEFCPYGTTGVERCVSSVTSGGEIVLGKKKVPIVNPVTIQGGYTQRAYGGPEDGYAKFIAATNGVTLSRAAQPIPGGLAGVVAPQGAPALVKTVIAAFFENGLAGVNATLELARPASEIRLNENHLAEALGVALKLPVRVHLENPFLGSSCYVGSSSSPIRLELTSGESSPPGPGEPITGGTGEVDFLEKGKVLALNEAVLVDKRWSAPAASGCGGFLSFLVDPLVNEAGGLPSPAGANSALLKSTIHTTTRFALEKAAEGSP